MDSPSIYKSLDYRESLASRLDYLKKDRGVRVSDICEELGFKSTSYLAMIVDGRRSLRPKKIPALSKALRMNPLESKVFQLQLQLVESEKLSDRQTALENILKQDGLKETRPHLNDFYRFFSEWYHVSVLKLLETDWRDLSDVQKATSLDLRDHHIQKSIRLIKRLGLKASELKVIELEPVLKRLFMDIYLEQVLKQSLEQLQSGGLRKRRLLQQTLITSESTGVF